MRSFDIVEPDLELRQSLHVIISIAILKKTYAAILMGATKREVINRNGHWDDYSPIGRSHAAVKRSAD